MNIYMLIDRSGSMLPKWGEVITSINVYVEELAKKKGMKKSKATVAVFDGFKGLAFDVLREATPVKKWQPIAVDEVAPRGMTPLYDAVSKLTDLISTDKPETATVVVMTDGLENASIATSKEKAKAQLDELKDKGFDVVFLGADFDAFAQASSLGVAAGQTLNVTQDSYDVAASSLASRTVAYASTGDVKDWTVKDRNAAAGKKK